jgi:hypothetical protein
MVKKNWGCHPGESMDFHHERLGPGDVGFAMKKKTFVWR